MTRILTVDDSRAVRTIINKSLEGQFELLEAEDGEKALEILSNESVDLILLDITMPVMDGPEMLKELRARGNKTPVVLLTAESKTSLIGKMMQVGISDYILKPFKPAELIEKITNVLGLDVAPGGEPGESGKPTGGKHFVDALLIDDMENVSTKFGLLMPDTIELDHVSNGADALKQCRNRVYRTVIVDMDIPGVNSIALTSQLRVLQPSAAFVGLYMRNFDNPARDSREQGFDGHLVKPFDPAQINEFLSQYYDAEDLLTLEKNVLSISSFPGSKDRRAQNVARVISLTSKAIESLAAACHEVVIMDLTNPPPTETIPKILIAAKRRSVEVGIEFRVVGSDTVTKGLASLSDTATIPAFGTLAEAQEQEQEQEQEQKQEQEQEQDD